MEINVLADENDIPYISLKLDRSVQLDDKLMDLIKLGLKPNWYESDGIKLFAEKIDGKITGKWIALILLKP
jgi:hypothetical protein